MKTFSSYLNTCKQDLVFTRYRQGIKVFLPEKKHLKNLPDSFYTQYGLSALMKRSFNIYFNDHESRLLALNDETAKHMGFYSLSDGIGKTMFDISPSDNAFSMIKTDRDVISSQTQKMVDDRLIRKDAPDIEQPYLSIKMPFYDDTNQLAGLLGCSVHLNQQSPASFLSFILNTGILRSEKTQPTELELNGQHLTKMQQACASLLLKGYTAKAIGHELNISSRTVEVHINNIKEKLACHTKTELILKLIHGG